MKQNHPSRWSQSALGIIIVLSAAAIGSQDTWATYTSRAISGKNVMRGGSIELSVSPDAPDSGRLIALAGDADHPYGMVVKNDGRNVLGYRARFVTEGDDGLCGALRLTAKLMGKEMYDGRLVDFEYASENPLERHQTDAWRFSIGMPESVSEFDESATCGLRWHLDAWQGRFLMLGMGWYDGVDGETFTLGIKPKEPVIPEPTPAIPPTSETIVPVELLVPTIESVPDSEGASSGAMAEEAMPGENKTIE